MNADALTAERIGLTWLRAAVAPVGAFGRRHDDAIAPYGPGDEARARTEITEVVGAGGAVGPRRRVARCARRCARFRSRRRSSRARGSAIR